MDGPIPRYDCAMRLAILIASLLSAAACRSQEISPGDPDAVILPPLVDATPLIDAGSTPDARTIRDPSSIPCADTGEATVLVTNVWGPLAGIDVIFQNAAGDVLS